MPLRFSGRVLEPGAPADAQRARLRELHRELAGIEQGAVDTRELDALCAEVARPALLEHRDASARAYGACILADMLRLYAPNAPFSARQLKSIFALFRDVLTAPGVLASPDDALHPQTVYLLESLSTVQSAVLILDIQGADAAVAQLFERALSVADGLPKHAELCLVDLLSQLIDESEHVPPGVIEALIDAFSAHGGQVAAGVCRATSDRLQREAARYFNDAFAQHDDPDVYVQVERVAAAVPELLLNVIPLLEEQLAAENKTRALATAALGHMFASAPALGAERRARGLAELYPGAWRAWLVRAYDKSAGIRTAMIEALGRALGEYPALGADGSSVLASRLKDPDERVRAAAVRALGSLGYETLVHHVPHDALHTLGERMRDMSAGVRAAALGALGRVYAVAAPELERGSTVAGAFAWIPAAMLRCSYVGARDVAVDAGVALARHVFVFGDAAQLVDFVDTLDDKEYAALLHCASMRLERPSAFDTYVHACETRSSAAAEARTAAAELGGGEAALVSFAQLHDTKALRMLRRAMDVRSPAADARDARAALVQHLESVAPDTAATIERVAVAGGYPVIAQDAVPALLALAPARAGAARLLRDVARRAPQLLTPHADALADAAQRDNYFGHVLLAALVRYRPAAVRATPELVLALAAAMRSGDSGAPAAQALCILAARERRGSAAAALRAAADEIVADLARGEIHAGALYALASVLKHAPQLVSEPDAAVDAAVHRVLLSRWDAAESMLGAWTDETPGALAVRLAALRLVARRVVAARDTAVGEPALALLWRVASAGQADDLGVPEAARARMRAYAAICILKLMRCDAYAPLVNARLARLVHVLQDEEHHVRAAVLHRLLVHLTCRTLPDSMHALIYMVAHDPDDEMRARVTTYTQRNAAVVPADKRHDAFELVFAQLIALLATHPDFDLSSAASIAEYSTYVDFYLSCVASAQNIAFLASVAATVQRCTFEGVDTAALHTLAELAHELVQRHAAHRGWNATAAHVDLPPPFEAAHESASRFSPQVADLLDRRQSTKRVRRT